MVDTNRGESYTDIIPQNVTNGGETMNKKKIGMFLVELRGERSQKEVADAVGISDSALSMYENGDRIPRDTIKVRIAEYYNRTVGEIFFTQ